MGFLPEMIQIASIKGALGQGFKVCEHILTNFLGLGCFSNFDFWMQGNNNGALSTQIWCLKEIKIRLNSSLGAVQKLRRQDGVGRWSAICLQ